MIKRVLSSIVLFTLVVFQRGELKGMMLQAQILQSSDNQTPNVIVIVADDLGYGDLSCYGADDIQTPNIDKLARMGVKFTRFYSNGPECTPTRTAFLTGRYQQRVGGLECAIGLGNVGRYSEALELSDKNELGLPAAFSAIPKMFNESDYNTAIVGKWHLGNQKGDRPIDHGFDYSFGPIGGAVDYYHHTEPRGTFLNGTLDGSPDLFENDTLVSGEGKYLTHLITEKSLQWLDEQARAKPFFIYIPYTSPHSPYQAPNDFPERPISGDKMNVGDRETYIKMVESLDSGVGKIIDYVYDEGIQENTLIVFFSDNGPARIKGSAGSLRGNKGQLFEGGIRVPCIVSWPGTVDQDIDSDVVGMSMDFATSFAELLHFTPDKSFDGMDVLELGNNQVVDLRRDIFWRSKRYERVKKSVQDKNGLKYIFETDKNGTREYLFDLENDLSEKDNLILEMTAEASKLKQKLEAWENEVQAER
ncbi:MAG: sulfatase-like hydrolase/transferase [Cyclobacteriaceae bacterium]